MNSPLCRLFQVSANQRKKIRGRLVTGWQASIQRLKMSPADGAFNVLSGLSQLEKSPQCLAVHGIPGFKFTDGEFCLSHETDSAYLLNNLCVRRSAFLVERSPSWFPPWPADGPLLGSCRVLWFKHHHQAMRCSRSQPEHPLVVLPPGHRLWPG